ncbi:MAG: right-handed parallel beta-helix repeat-containing protein [Verrucomicrobia bacterium]|nr:right-handed parallel beta-helix repeat-containing protein [Verrucomicrobiota bacterium]
MRISLHLGLATLLGSLNLSGAHLHVAPAGDDTGPGTRERPFATLAAARDAVRALKRRGPLPEAVTVHVHGGTHFVERAVEFTREDSGSEAAPILYLAEPGSVVRLTGGRAVAGWRAVSDPAVLERLVPEARGQVQVADLRAQGITDFGRLSPRGFGAGNPVAEAELFYDDEPMTLARWPNRGFRDAKAKTDDLTVIVDTGRVGRWAAEVEPWVFAYWHHDWAELYEPLAGVDGARSALLRTGRVRPVYGITPSRARWYAFNLLAELDTPGEYYLDRGRGLLYFWAPRPGGRAVLSMTEGLVRARDVSRVTFRGFTFEACRGAAIRLEGGSQCRLVGCTIRNTGQHGVHVSDGEGHEVMGCDVYFTGTGGISMSGGRRATLTPGRHNAENNHVHHYARRARTYHCGIAVSGVGHRIAHNLIHDGPHMALSAGGNDHRIEYNEIHNVVEESGDAGAYYVGRDWTQRGNILRYNYWHDILGSTGYGGMTIYLDDQHCGHVIHGNLFERCMQSVFIGGGDDNVVTHNVFLDCRKSAHIDNRGMNWQKPATDDPNGELRSRLRAVPYTNELWRGRYPTLASILDDDPGVPIRNVVAGNLSAGGTWDDIARSIRHLQTVTNNLVFDRDPGWVRLLTDAARRPVRLEFKDPAAVDAIGFVPLPLGKMGLYKDDRRATWPVAHEVRPVRFPEPAAPKAQAGRGG